MKRSMAYGIAAAGERGSTEMLMWGGGALELASLAVARVMAGEGAEVGSWRKEDVIYVEKAIET